MESTLACEVCQLADGTVGDLFVESAAFAANGETIAVASSKHGGNVWDGELRIFEIKNGKDGKVDLVHGCATTLGCSLTDVLWITDRKTLAAASDDGNVYVFSLDRGSHGLEQLAMQNTFPDHEDVVTGLAMDRLNKRLFSSSFDGDIKLWDVSRPDRPIHTFTAEKQPLQNGTVWDVMCPSQNVWVSTVHQDGIVRIWDYRAETAGACVQEFNLSIHGAALSLADNVVKSAIAIGMEDGHVVVVDVRKPGAFDILSNISSHGAPVNAVQTISHGNGGMVSVSGGDDGNIVIRQVSKNDEKTESFTSSQTHSDYIRTLIQRPLTATSTYGIQILTGGWDGTVKLHEIKLN